ncbi:MAG: transporter substrate-binding domain-containing protein [Eubacterium sp.]|nr:transporter substrate-binding domain-containing protein [Eubacterium sp.]
MKNLKKILAVLLAVAIIGAVVAGCAKKAADNNETTDINTAQASDLEYIKNKGELVIGITYFEPMDYLDDKGELTGFEVEFGKAVCEKLGVTPKFQEISWDAKETELSAKNIDCIWNGLTITPERQEAMSISNPYMNNKQVIICKKENAEAFAKAGGLDGKTVVAEKESAGEEAIQSEDYKDFFGKANYTPVEAMKNALMEVKAGTADAAVIDYVTGIGSLGEGSDYADLAIVEKSFADEQYGIAFRKDSDTTAEVNKIIDELKADGTLQKIADKYNLGEQLVK